MPPCTFCENSEDEPSKKLISEITKEPLDFYQAANAMRGLKPDDEGYNNPDLATEAAAEMDVAGWRFWTYSKQGDEVHIPPDWLGPMPIYYYL